MFLRIKSIISKIKDNRDGSTLASNLGYLFLLQIASYAFPLITMPYLARVIGTEGFGRIALAAAIIVWFQTIADWGFNYTATRDIAKNRDDKEKVSEIFSNVFWARVFLMFVSFIVLIICLFSIPKLKENAGIIIISFLMIPGHIMFPDWFFQAMERMKYITILNLLSKTFFTITIFLFIKEKEDYILQPLFTSLGFIVSGIIAMYYILEKWKIRLQLVSFKMIFKTIESSTDVFINNIVPNFYNTFSTVLLGFIGGDVSTGLFDAGRKFINIAENLLGIISRVFFPFLARKGEKHGLYATIHMSVSIFVCIVLFISAPVLMEILFTDEFKGAVNVLRILSISLIFTSIYNAYGINYMLLRGLENKLKKITILSSLVGLSLSFPLIYSSNYIGAAMVITITRGILSLFTLFYSRRHRYTYNT